MVDGFSPRTAPMSGERFQLSNVAPEYRRPGVIAVLLFFAMFLPWYSRSTDALVKGRPETTNTHLTAFQSFSWVEAAVLLVAVAILGLIYVRGQRRPFHLPGGDGLVVAASGVWVTFLVLYRLVDNKQDLKNIGGNVVSADFGPTWGIFVTLFIAIALTFSGLRLRAAHLAEPPNPTAVETARQRARSPLPVENTRWSEDEHETQVVERGRAVDPLRYDDD